MVRLGSPRWRQEVDEPGRRGTNAGILVGESTCSQSKTLEITRLALTRRQTASSAAGVRPPGLGYAAINGAFDGELVAGHVTRERVRQIEPWALRKLGHFGPSELIRQHAKLTARWVIGRGEVLPIPSSAPSVDS